MEGLPWQHALGVGGLSFPAITVQKGERAGDDGKNTGPNFRREVNLDKLVNLSDFCYNQNSNVLSRD